MVEDLYENTVMGMRLHTGGRASARKGRGAVDNPEGRFESVERIAEEDGWAVVSEEDVGAGGLATKVTEEVAKSILSRNDSPDIPFTWSINPYRGCEHGCIYCYARPSHAYLGLSPGLDFESRIFAKTNAAGLLNAELRRRGHVCDPIALGANTDPYQPVEKRLRITRSILEVLRDSRHPVGIVTKNALVLRDVDILRAMAADNLCRVFISITTLDHELARRLEPRASSPSRRLEALQVLRDAGVPCGVMVAPVIPFLTDDSVERVLEAAASSGAQSAGYVLLRLPYEIRGLFEAWLDTHFPLKAAHVMQRVRDMRGGRANDPEFGSRMRGQGELAALLARRFESACRKLGLSDQRQPLNTGLFRPPDPPGQLPLF